MATFKKHLKNILQKNLLLYLFFILIYKAISLRSALLKNKDIRNFIDHRTIVQREFLVLPDKKIVYLNNAKVACSSIRSTFISEQVDDDNSIHTIVLDNVTNHLNEIEKDYFKFTFVRDPFSRLVSCYESKYHTDADRGIADLADYLFGYLKGEHGFEAFLRKIIDIPDILADRHFISQYYLIYDRRYHCLVDFIGKYEQLQQDFDPIKQKFALKPLPHLNQAVKKNWMDYYNLDTAQLVKKRYAKDIALFDYEDTYQRLIDYLKNKKEP